MTGLGRFLPLTSIGVSKNYVRNNVIRVTNYIATLLANIDTEVCQPWHANNTMHGENIVETHSQLNSHASTFRASLLINYSLNI